MYVLVVFTWFLLSSCTESRKGSTHLSDILKLKCDALPYRTAYTEYRCYFAVLQEIDSEQANEKCSSIFLGAKISSIVPEEIFRKMMVDKSKFHLGRDTLGGKQIMCTFGSEYKCDSDSKMLVEGRCIMRAEKKMNFEDAENYCGEQSMEIPAPENDMDNRIVQESLMKDPAWVRKSFVRQKGNKWSQGRNYSRWTSCYKHNERKCSKDIASVIDSTGYWRTEETRQLMDVICITNAGNDFTKGVPKDEPCISYHNMKGLPLLAPATFGQSITCYFENRTTTRYQAIGKATVETRRGCEVLCDSKPTCTSFSIEDKELASSCILLSSKTSDQICTDQTTIFQKKKFGCTERTNHTAEFGEDPCIEFRNDTAFRGFGVKHICDPTKSKLYIIRAVDENGRRITLDNEKHNYMRKTDNGFFEYVFDQFSGGGHVEIPNLVAFTCVIAEGEKCPCEPLKHLSVIPDKPNYPATTDRVNPCNSTKSYLWYNVAKSAAYGMEWQTQWDTARAFVTCKAGMWILWKESVYSSWGVTSLACYL